MQWAFLIIGVILAGMIVTGASQIRQFQIRVAAGIAAAVVLAGFFTLASFRYVGEDKVGVVSKSIGFQSLPPGKIIATAGEKGPQADVLPPGWHPWYWPFIYKIDFENVVEIDAGMVGLLTAKDGRPLPEDTTYAPEWPAEDEKRMSQNANYFLTDGEGYRGPQTTVLKPGAHRINPKLFSVDVVPVTTIEKATVGVVKSNVGERPAAGLSASGRALVERGQRGIWREPLLEGQYYLNTDAFEITKISTKKKIIRYTALRGHESRNPDADISAEESEIRVRTSDGFTFPVDVRVECEIRPHDAPLVVANVGDEEEGLLSVLNSAVRAIFRNNAEAVKALNYVQQRSEQETQSLAMLQTEMSKIGVTVTAVRIGDVGDQDTLGELLKTQTDREIALQEQETFKEQQRAAEQRKQLTRTEQEAEEEKKLATAKYAVDVAEEDRKRHVIDAVRIKAEAQANAYQLIAEQIGSGNAALVEVLKVVGESDISITPRVMVVGGNGNQGAGQRDVETTALIGTMLDTMISEKSSPVQTVKANAVSKTD